MQCPPYILGLSLKNARFFVEKGLKVKQIDKKLKIKQRKYSGSSSVVSIRIPNQLIQRIDETAQITGRNRNDIIMRCLDFALDNLEIEEDDND